MKHSAVILTAAVGLATAAVPMEQSHKFLNTAVQSLLQLNNRFEIVDPVFGLLGNAAAVDGAGLVTNLDCLQQITADEAFTNALALKDETQRINGLVNALLFRALEKNTVEVGLLSVDCDEVAVNPEIAAISQHQDAAAVGAAQINKNIALALAVQIASVGGDPTLALLAGTFAPGEIGDPTAAGNSCNDEDDEIGCIYTQNLLVPDATIEEINAAVLEAEEAGQITEEVLAADVLADLIVAGTIPDAAAAVVTRQGGGNIQSFAGALGGPAPAVSETGDADRPFEVNGATFGNLNAALQRSCAVQNNACANAANSGQLEGGVGQCGEQEAACRDAAAAVAKAKRGMKARQNSALSFGSCSDPGIIFAEGLDGRTEASFAPANSGDFSQGSAQNINIISSFICGQLSSACGADEGTVQACESAKAAAQGLEGQAAADAFNTALGI